MINDLRRNASREVLSRKFNQTLNPTPVIFFIIKIDCKVMGNAGILNPNFVAEKVHNSNSHIVIVSIIKILFLFQILNIHN